MTLTWSKNKIHQLWSTIAQAVAMITKAIASSQNPHQQPMPIDMDTEEEHSTNSTSLTESTPSQPLDLSAIINEIKMEIATLTTKLQTSLQPLMPPQATTTPPFHLVK